MNTKSQFWTLIKFQVTANPLLWFLFILFIPEIMELCIRHRFLVHLPPVYSLMVAFICSACTLCPGIFYGVMIKQSDSNAWFLTRAIDRNILLRTKLTLFYFISLAIPIVILIFSLKTPDLKIFILSTESQQWLSHFRGSSLLKNINGATLTLIPAGDILISESTVWKFVISCLAAQILILLIYPLRYRRILFITLSLITLCWQLFEAVTEYDQKIYLDLFFFFSAHQSILWILTALAFILTQLWCERRFARLEQ